MDSIDKLAIQQLHNDLEANTAAVKELVALLKAQAEHKDEVTGALPVNISNLEELAQALVPLIIMLTDRIDQGVPVTNLSDPVKVEVTNG